MSFLPINEKEMKERGWQQPDFVLVTGDAYVDHHSFGTAIIGRLLEQYGYKVAILPQPNYKSAEDFRIFGKPRLGLPKPWTAALMQGTSPGYEALATVQRILNCRAWRRR